MPVCERGNFCQCVHMCIYVCTVASVQQATWAMLAPLKGVNYPALFFAWDIILSLYKARPRQGLWNHCDQLFSLRQTNGRQGFIRRRGLGRSRQRPLRFHSRSVDLQQNTTLYDPKIYTRKPLIPWISFLFSPLPVSQSVAVYLLPSSSLSGTTQDLVQLL